jgi:energy-coupling factor transporter ATP-binding protein EcfA2
VSSLGAVPSDLDDATIASLNFSGSRRALSDSTPEKRAPPMIYHLSIKDPAKTPVKWLADVAAFRQPRAFEFKPGLNILWGRNGSGKTTLTKVLARLFHCEQGNQPVVTEESLRELVGDGSLKVADVRGSLSVVHDGQGVRHFDPGHAVGLIAGGAAFDWDFGGEGVANTMFRGSAGQTTMFRFDRLINEVVAGEVPEVAWKFPRGWTGEDIWGQRVELAAHLLEGNAEKGQPTVLLDEPERSYDLNAQVGVWRFLRAYSDQVQFIVASHSLFALKIPDANYVELSPRYLAGSEAVLEILQKWPAEKPAKISKEKAKIARSGVDKRKRKEPRGG